MKTISGAGWLLSRRRGRLEHEHRVNNIPAHIRYHFKKQRGTPTDPLRIPAGMVVVNSDQLNAAAYNHSLTG